MHTSVVIDIVLLIVIVAGIFGYRQRASYQMGDSVLVIVSSLAALFLFLFAIGVIHL
jgi:hypothetical protein